VVAVAVAVVVFLFNNQLSNATDTEVGYMKCHREHVKTRRL